MSRCAYYPTLTAFPCEVPSSIKRTIVAISMAMVVAGCSDGIPDNTDNSTTAQATTDASDESFVDSLVSLQDASSDESGESESPTLSAAEEAETEATQLQTSNVVIPPEIPTTEAATPVVNESEQIQPVATQIEPVDSVKPQPQESKAETTADASSPQPDALEKPAQAAEETTVETAIPQRETQSEVVVQPDVIAEPEVAPEPEAAKPVTAVEAQNPEQEEQAAEQSKEAIAELEVATQPSATETASNKTSFESHTTPGFKGKILDNKHIEVSWQSYPKAVGYNLYRDSEYYSTVFDTKFIDTDIGDADSYYYEIEAFDEPRNFTRFADGLTVRMRETKVSLPPQIESGYDLVFSDEFDGDTLDKTRWNTSYIWGTDIIINDELQYYVDINNNPDFPFNPFVVKDGILEIKSIPTPDELKSQAKNQPYLSGVITSYDAFKFTYGYAEARLKLPRGRGFWAAFWLLNAYYNKNKPEIDIMEHLGHNLDRVYHTYHYYDNNEVLHSTESEGTGAMDFTSEFHVYAVEWRPGTVIYYVDGIERHRVTDQNVSNEEMYIIANTAVGGWWPGSPDDTTPFPASYKIDYIRAYQKRGQLDPMPQFDGVPTVKPATEVKQRTPNHLPPYELWPEGYPSRL